MLPPKVSSLLGLSRRAGALALGDWAVTSALQRKVARVVFLAADAGGATQRRFLGLCRKAGVPLFRIGSRAELGAVVGTDPKAVLAVTSPEFGRSVLAGLTQAGLHPEGGGDFPSG